MSRFARQWLFAAALAAGSAALTKSTPSALPLEMLTGNEDAQFLASVLEGFHSEPLWPEAALKGHKARYRLTISAISFVHAHELQVSVDIGHDGEAHLKSAVWIRDEKVDEHSYRLSPNSASSFEADVASSGLWVYKPEIWQLKDKLAWCAHGRQYILEKHDAAGYDVSYAEARCTSPKGMEKLVANMVRLAREDHDKWFEVP